MNGCESFPGGSDSRKRATPEGDKWAEGVALYVGEPMDKDDNEVGESASGVKSVSQAIRILNVVAEMDGPVSLKEIAARAGVAPSKAHRYLQSLCSCGFLNQTSKSGAYDLGMQTLRLGLAAINRVDIVNRAGEALGALTNETRADSFITVWAENGPAIVRFERSSKPAVAMLGAGVSIPVLTTATGLVFLTYGHPEWSAETAKRHAENNFDEVLKELPQKIETIRKAGYASTIGVIMAGRQCISAPIISYDDKIIAAVSLVSTRQDIVEADSPEVTALLEFCRRHSIRKRGYAEETLIEKRIAL